MDVVVDLVAGAGWPVLLDLLRRGCTWQPRSVFENLIRYIEAGELQPLVAQSWPLA